MERIFHQQTSTTKQAKEYYLGWKYMILGWDLNLLEEMKNTENGKYMDRKKKVFFPLFVFLKINWLLKAKIITMYCEVYSKHRGKICGYKYTVDRSGYV